MAWPAPRPWLHGRPAFPWKPALVGVSPAELQGGDSLRVQAEIVLGGLEPADVRVEFYHGHVDQQGQIIDGRAIAMTQVKPNGSESYLFSGAVPCERSGQYGYAIRILPRHSDISNIFEMHLIRWA